MTDGSDDLKRDGFLAEACALWSAQHVAANQSSFDQLTALNRCLQTLLTTEYRADIRFTKLETLLIAGLLNRFITNFQSAVLLLQRGLNQEARILARSCLECCFAVGAATEIRPQFAERLTRAHNDARKKFGASLKDMAIKEQTLTDEQIGEIDRLNLEYAQQGLQTFDFFEMATKAGLQHWYMFYRRLSNYAAHPSMDALTYRFDEETELVDFGPNDDSADLANVADDLCMFACLFCELFDKLAEVSKEVLGTVKIESDRVHARKAALLDAPG